MEWRDTRLSRRLQGTQVTTENGHVVLTTHPGRYESAQPSLPPSRSCTRMYTRTYTEMCSLNFLDFAHRADTMKSTPLINGAISGSVIYPPRGNTDKSLKNLTPFFRFVFSLFFSFSFFSFSVFRSSLRVYHFSWRTRAALRLLRSVPRAIDSNLFAFARYVAGPRLPSELDNSRIVSYDFHLPAIQIHKFRFTIIACFIWITRGESGMKS